MHKSDLIKTQIRIHPRSDANTKVGCVHNLCKNGDNLSTKKKNSTDKQMCIRTASYTKRMQNDSSFHHLNPRNYLRAFEARAQKGNSQERTLRTEYMACSRAVPSIHLADENRKVPDEFSVKTVSVWPPTDCIVKLCSRGADTVFFSKPSITVSSSFKVKDTCREIDFVKHFYL